MEWGNDFEQCVWFVLGGSTTFRLSTVFINGTGLHRWPPAHYLQMIALFGLALFMCIRIAKSTRRNSQVNCKGFNSTFSKSPCDARSTHLINTICHWLQVYPLIYLLSMFGHLKFSIIICVLYHGDPEWRTHVFCCVFAIQYGNGDIWMAYSGLIVHSNKLSAIRMDIEQCKHFEPLSLIQ